ncbi:MULTISPECIES: hypothetical protein [unclassified Kitasatospora]|uniref:hypothetical protein n=1 Tax=unclassified Kitasatospora TaxID=2633591 RepID=UPI00070A353E|nr:MULTISPECIES: hypothetical protein [unclassified Kitasatospora]KQV14515.1 hypothetical protein ASC99_30570 [Kitasatospora sp. Root107]KRB68053.1 hypothetical protein ASE03_29290 [Kitasatospora sp. Root187]
MIILDSSALAALADGHERLHRLVDSALRSPFQHLLVPVLCLVEAEVKDEGTAHAILSLPSVEFEPLDASTAVMVATMVRDGFGGQDLAHVIATSLPTPVRPLQHLILTARPGLYPPGIHTVDIEDPRLAP